MIKPEETDVLEKLHWANKHLEGICFALAMRNEDGNIQIYERENQPCYGELRKYKSTHGDEATQDENRPGDLTKPFPKGKPEALAIRFDGWDKIRLTDEGVEFFDYLLSDRSPFVRGFGGTGNIEWTPNREGIVLLDLEIDPTVLVNMLKHIQYNSREWGSVDYKRFSNYKKAGMSEVQAFCATYTVSHQYGRLSVAYDYIYPTFADLDRIVAQDPYDLTGGTLANRFDYSRRRLHEIFYSEKDGVNVFKEISRKVGAKPYGKLATMTEEEFFKGFFSVWNDHFNKIEKEKAA